jgi:squalene-hopene/tetraprenyl-beta-curcumene cyclase
MMKYLLAICLFASVSSLRAGEMDAAVATEAAKKAAGFLLQQQNEDGTFGKSMGAKMPGVVSLVVKALASSPEKVREDNPEIVKAVKFLLASQLPSGAIANPDFGLENYNTSCAVIALAALENPAHKPVLEKAKAYILSGQCLEETGYNSKEHPRAYGGIGYGNSKRPDLSNTSFSLEALKAVGLDEKSPTWEKAVMFIKRCQDNDETNDVEEMKGGDDTGAFVYLPGDSEFGTITTKSGKKLPKPYGNMTYQAVKSLIYAGMKSDDPVLTAAFKWIKSNYAVDHQPGGSGAQGYYYYLIAFAKAFSAMNTTELELTDGRKVNWAKDLATQLISMQRTDGSFVNTDSRWMESDSVLCTAYALDALNYCIQALKK